MHKVKSILPQKAFFKLYYAIVYPHLLQYMVYLLGLYFANLLESINFPSNQAAKDVDDGIFRDNATRYFK